MSFEKPDWLDAFVDSLLDFNDPTTEQRQTAKENLKRHITQAHLKAVREAEIGMLRRIVTGDQGKYKTRIAASQAILKEYGYPDMHPGINKESEEL